VHGACGIVGTLLLGVLAMHGAGAHLLGEQALAVIVTIAWAFTLTYAVAWLVDRTVGLRVPAQVEIEGLDTVVHAESAYDFGNVRATRMG
jgi:ammonium transporter, Amt family